VHLGTLRARFLLGKQMENESKTSQETETQKPQETEENKKQQKKHTRLSPSQWRRLGALWERGETTTVEISKKYDVTREHVSRKFKQLGFKRGAKVEEHAKTIQKAIEQEVKDDARVFADRIKETKEEHYKQVKLLNQLAMTEIAKAKQDGKEFAVCEPNLKALERAITINSKARQEKYSILGLDKDDAHDSDIPELTIRELTEAEVDDIKMEQEKSGAGDLDPLEVLEQFVEGEEDVDS